MMINDTTATGPPSTASRSSRFLGCFGFSGEKMQETDHKVNTSSRRRRRISDWSFSCKKTDVKSAHVDVTTVHRKPKSEKGTPAKSSDAPATCKSDEQKSNRKKWIDIVKIQNGSFGSRRKDAKPAAVAGVESPEKKTVTTTADRPFVSSPMKHLTHSKSLPAVVPKRRKPAKAHPAGGGGDGGEGVDRSKPPSARGEFDSIIAMSMLLSIFVVMVLWGKLCAIFCTCVWFFVAPRLVATGRSSAVATVERRLPEIQKNLNLESVEYKKKVVLEGLLQRKHRNVVGRL